MGNPTDDGLKSTTDGHCTAPSNIAEVSGEAPPDYHAAIATSPSRLSTPYRPFPPVMHARYQWKLTGTFHLCSEDPDERLYAVAAHSGLKGDFPRVVLHNGPSDRDPLLAAACEERRVGLVDRYSPNSTIQLPPLAPAADPTEFVKEVMQARTVGESGMGYAFSIEVDHGGKLVREDFEWRKSKKGSNEEFKDGGFKLLRLSSRQHQESSHNSTASSSRDVATEDGYDVVALFKWNKTLTNMMHPFELRFVGAALSGSLGERWAVTAVITGLRLWWLHAGGRANRKTAAVGEGSG
ncbi:hypothetical protein F4820DRAFT_441099 [Hypoxylon rubiginosum]|uniref:Uncharacterized protein n=1 Tax=Hypoxylon rubiginosum TaxID=110542 RepID=A0ACB9YIY1_9PEZI|nr:hypothetical protein F4820DRAFT_441099 [Hypoxylon rubiginosum]